MRLLHQYQARLHQFVRVQQASRVWESLFLSRLQSSESRRMTQAAALEEWVVKNGGKTDGARVGQSAYGLGLVAKAAVAPGAKLVELPSSCQLTYDGATDPRLLKLIDQVPTELWGAKLALQLLAMRAQGPSSHFAAYVADLPVGVPGVPTFFPGDAIKAIEYPPVTTQVVKRCRWLADFSKNLKDLPGTPEDPFGGAAVDINALGWAMACVTSRAFRVKGPDHPAVMLPLIDMSNHSFDPNCEVLPLRDTPGAVGLFAKKAIKEGEQLLLNYGNLPNDFLMMDYGFILPCNPHDRVAMRFDVGLLQAGADTAHAKTEDGKRLEIEIEGEGDRWRQEWLEGLKLVGADANTEVCFGGQAHVDSRLVAAARVLAARSVKEVEGRGMPEMGDLEQPISKANEMAALRTIMGVGLVALSQFSTSYDQDFDVIKKQSLKPTLSTEMMMAVSFRLEKKRLLTNALKALAAKLKALS